MMRQNPVCWLFIGAMGLSPTAFWHVDELLCISVDSESHSLADFASQEAHSPQESMSRIFGEDWIKIKHIETSRSVLLRCRHRHWGKLHGKVTSSKREEVRRWFRRQTCALGRLCCAEDLGELLCLYSFFSDIFLLLSLCLSVSLSFCTQFLPVSLTLSWVFASA